MITLLFSFLYFFLFFLYSFLLFPFLSLSVSSSRDDHQVLYNQTEIAFFRDDDSHREREVEREVLLFLTPQTYSLWLKRYFLSKNEEAVRLSVRMRGRKTKEKERKKKQNFSHLYFSFYSYESEWMGEERRREIQNNDLTSRISFQLNPFTYFLFLSFAWQTERERKRDEGRKRNRTWKNKKEHERENLICKRRYSWGTRFEEKRTNTLVTEHIG